MLHDVQFPMCKILENIWSLTVESRKEVEDTIFFSFASQNSSFKFADSKLMQHLIGQYLRNPYTGEDKMQNMIKFLLSDIQIPLLLFKTFTVSGN